MKRKLLFIAAALIVLSLIAGGTLAYFTAEDTARNVITSGAVTAELVEQQRTADGKLVPYPAEAIPVMPGQSVSKIVTVRSDEQPAWIRARYTVAVQDAAGKAMDIPAAKLAKVVSIEPDAAHWTLRDGWWYYSGAVGGGESTSALFESIDFSGPDMGNEYQGATITVDVAVQVVQSANNGESALDAMGWPKT